MKRQLIIEEAVQHTLTVGPEQAMRDYETSRGYLLLKPGDFPWLRQEDWQYEPIISLDGWRVRIIALLVVQPGRGTFSRLVTGIIKDDFRPCVLSPFMDMKAILERWNWRKQISGSGFANREERWFPQHDFVKQRRAL